MTLSRPSTKKTVCKKHSGAKASRPIWGAKSKASFVDLLDDDIDPAVEAHMSLSSLNDLSPIPLESHDISWECEFQSILGSAFLQETVSGATNLTEQSSSG